MNATLPLAAYRGLLGAYLRPQRGRVFLLAALLLAGLALQLLSPQVIRYFIDTTQTGGAAGALELAAGAFIALGLAQRAIDLGARYVGLDLGWQATNALRHDLALHCLRLDMPFHKSHTPGELIERIDGDVTQLAGFLSRFLIRLVANALLVLAVLALLYREDWRVGLGLTLYVALSLAALAALQNFGMRRWTAERQADAEKFGFLEERLSGMEDIRGAGAEAHALQELLVRLRAVMRAGRRAWLAGSLSYVVHNFLFISGYGLGLAAGAYLYSQGAVTIGGAYIIVYYIGMLGEPLENIRGEAEDFQRAAAGINRVRELFAARPQVQERPTAALPPGPLPVAFDRVSFTYDDGGADGTTGADDGLGRVLRDVTFAAPAGRVVGVLGRTGSGKTTLTRLLFRLYDATEGGIRLGGMDIRATSFADLRGRVGMVTQDVQLFHASIRDNIAFFDPRVTDAQIARALTALGIWDWAQAMPQGLDTLLGPGGQGLSAGEAQLLAFARVFLKDPGLVILDEAASRLDPITEQRLERAIDALLCGRTGLVIAHRLRTVGRADDILILEDGRVAEFGPRAALAADPASRFAQLLRAGLEEALA
jgi:ATP-binding cassette, subfamily B, bacterial